MAAGLQVQAHRLFRDPRAQRVGDIISVSIDIGGSWDELADHLNDGTPMALTPSSRYGRGLDACLARMGLADDAQPDMTARLMSWLRLAPGKRGGHSLMR